jgi:hypothetical protein
MLHQPRTRAGYFHERIDYFDWAPKATMARAI